MESEKAPALTLYYTGIDTDLFGQMWIAATDAGICCLRFDQDAGEFISSLAAEIVSGETPNIVHSEAHTAPYRQALLAYLTEKTPIPEDLPVDLHQLTEFQQEILNRVRQLPFGAATTYGEIADEIDNPNASRAIGQVLRRNPIPIIIPCHRVLSADGTLGGYGGVMGSERKILLLKHEGVILA